MTETIPRHTWGGKLSDWYRSGNDRLAPEAAIGSFHRMLGPPLRRARRLQLAQITDDGESSRSAGFGALNLSHDHTHEAPLPKHFQLAENVVPLRKERA